MINKMNIVIAGLLLGSQIAKAQFSNQKGKELGVSVTDSKTPKCVNGIKTVTFDVKKQNNTGIYLPVGASFEIKSEEHGVVKFTRAGKIDPVEGQTDWAAYINNPYKIDSRFKFGQTMFELRNPKDGEIYQRVSAKELMQEGKTTITRHPDSNFKGGVLFAVFNNTEILHAEGMQTFKIAVSGCPTTK